MEAERSLPLLDLETRAGVAPRSAFEALFLATERYFLVGDWLGLERAVRSLHGVAAERGAAAGRIVALLRVYRDALWDAFERDPGPGLTPRLLASLDDRLRDSEAAVLADRLDRGATAPLRLVLDGDALPSDATATHLALACTNPDVESAVPAIARLISVTTPFDRMALVLPDAAGDARCFETEVGLGARAADRAIVSIRSAAVLHAVEAGTSSPWCQGSQGLRQAPPEGLELEGCRAGIWLPLLGGTGLLGVGRISAVPLSDAELAELIWTATVLTPAARSWGDRLHVEMPPEAPLAADETLQAEVDSDLDEADEVRDIPLCLDDPEPPVPLEPMESPDAPMESAEEPMPMFRLPKLADEPKQVRTRRHDDPLPMDHLHGAPLYVDRRSASRGRGWVMVAAGVALGVLTLGAALATVLSAWDPSQALLAPPVDPPVAVEALARKSAPTRVVAQAPEMGFLTIRTTPPGVAVRVNGSVVGVSPLTWVQVPAGEVQVVAAQKGLRTWIKTLNLRDSEHRKLRVELTPDRSSRAGRVARHDSLSAPAQQDL